MIHRIKDAYLEIDGERIPIGEMMLITSDRIHVVKDCFAELNRSAYLKEHGEAILDSLGW